MAARKSGNGRKVAKSSSKKSVGRGRPRVYTPADEKMIVGMVRKHGLTGTQAALQGRKGKNNKFAKISLLTISKMIEGKVTLRRGRPPVKKAA